MEETIEERLGLCKHCLCDTDRYCHGDCHIYSKYCGAVEQKQIDDTEKQEWLNKAINTVRDIANEYFGNWEQSCKVAERFKKAMEK